MPTNPVNSTPAVPEHLPNGRAHWTADLLKVHVDEKIEDLRRAMADLRQSDQTAVSAALAAAEKAVDKALVAAEKAVDKAESNNQLWRAASNEWRDAMDDRERKFLSVEAYDAAHRAVAADIADLKKSRDQAVGRQAATTALIGAVFAIITVALRFIN